MSFWWKIDAAIDGHREEFIDEFKQFLSQPSVAAQGIGIEETARLVESKFQGLGARAEIVRTGGSPVVFGQLGNGPALLVYDHYDVQPPEPLELWESQPFEPSIRDGKIYARGASDDKGTLMARIQATRAMQSIMSELPTTLKFVTEGEEEIGSPYLDKFVEQNRGELEGAVGCLWEGGGKDAAGRPTASLGMKGIAYFELTAETGASDVHSSWGGIVPNAVWRLVDALATLRSPDGRLTLDGLSAHVAPISDADMAMLETLPFEEDQIKANFGIATFVGGLRGKDAQHKYLMEPTCTVCGVSSGYTGTGLKTVVPAQASTKLDFRLVPRLTPQLVEDLLRAHLERRGFQDVQVQRLASLFPSKADPTNPFIRATLDLVTQFYGQAPAVSPISAGGGPMYQLCETLGIPGISTGGVSHADARIHAPNEHIFLDENVTSMKFFARLVLSVAERAT